MELGFLSISVLFGVSMGVLYRNQSSSTTAMRRNAKSEYLSVEKRAPAKICDAIWTIRDRQGSDKGAKRVDKGRQGAVCTKLKHTRHPIIDYGLLTIHGYVKLVLPMAMLS